MFESDDFDQILSQLDFSCEESAKGHSLVKKYDVENYKSPIDLKKNNDLTNESSNLNTKNNCLSAIISSSAELVDNDINSPKHIKRKMVDAFFDHKSKRKFPGPAGLLTAKFKENKDEFICQMELLSQDVDFSQNCLNKDAFDSPLWHRVLKDVKEWNLCSVDTIKAIKQCSSGGVLRKRKAQIIAAFIESVDRSIIDPLITLRDSTGSIKCTLHRDAWSKFSPYVVADYCVLVLWKPTILTRGGTFKNHYLNITLSNIFAVYSSAVLDSNISKDLPDGYVKIYEGDYTVIKIDEQPLESGMSSSIVESTSETNELFEGLDNIFSDEVF